MSSLPGGVHAHKLVAETALAMAHECYDALMQRNDWWALWQSEHPGLNKTQLEALWCSKHQADFLAGARHILAAQLAQPISVDLKETIYSALVLDTSLRRGRG